MFGFRAGARQKILYEAAGGLRALCGVHVFRGLRSMNEFHGGSIVHEFRAVRG